VVTVASPLTLSYTNVLIPRVGPVGLKRASEVVIEPIPVVLIPAVIVVTGIALIDLLPTISEIL